jgi:DNA polymerase I-like protein with 3'-5' exonuclease and polymerase domains
LHFPDLTREAYLCHDVETHDPYMKTLGTNAIHRARGGRLLGFSVYAPGGFNQYFPLVPGIPGVEQPAGQWWNDQIRRGPILVGANQKYDLLWLLSEGIWSKDFAKREYGDVLINSSLLNENADDHNLDGQCLLYGVQPKKNDELLAAGLTLGLTTLQQIKDNMHLIAEAFPDVLASYANHDTYATGKVWEAQQPLLKAEGLTESNDDMGRAMDVVQLEQKFLPILVLMEAKGIRVDVDHAKALQEKLIIGIEAQKEVIKSTAGEAINFNPSGSLKNYIGKHYPDHIRGGKKNEYKCGDKELARYEATDPVIAAVMAARKLSKMEGTFVRGYILDKHVGGRLYPNIWQLGGQDSDGDESGGTITGRQSYSKPNLQNIPVRNKEWGPLLRAMVIADEGCRMASLDFSQQEPRWAITWAVRWKIPGAMEAAMEFVNNPDLDWHGGVAQFLGGPQWRDAGKVLVLARMYVQGAATCYAKMLEAGVPEENIAAAIHNFDLRMPFIKAASTAADNQAQKKGYVRTISSRKRRFDLWEPKLNWNQREARKAANLPNFPGLPRDEAMDTYFNGMKYPIQRYKTYPAFNAIVQGSSADQTKQVTVEAYWQDDLIPDLEIHDEILDGKIDESDDIINIYKGHMLETIKLAVPNKVGIKVGTHWMK